MTDAPPADEGMETALPMPDAPPSDEATETTPHTLWVWVLVVFGSVVVVLGTVSSWVEQQALDTDAFVSVTDELLADDEIRAALTVYLVDELYETVAVDDFVADAVPPDFERLAPVIAGALRGLSINAVDHLLQTDAAQEIWSATSRRAHETLVAVIEDDADVLSTTGGVVSIDLSTLLLALAEEVGLSGDRLDELPEDAGVVVLFESDELGTLQTAAKASKLLGALLLVLVIAAYAGAVYLARGRRRQTLRNCGIGLCLAAVLVLLARNVGSDVLVDNLRQSTDEEPARSVVEISSSLLRQVALTNLLVGLAIVAFSVAVGPTRLARGLRSRLAPLLVRHDQAVAPIGGVLVFLVLLWLKPGGPINGWVIGLGIAALCIAGVAWVQRVTMAEFTPPDE